MDPNGLSMACKWGGYWVTIHLLAGMILQVPPPMPTPPKNRIKAGWRDNGGKIHPSKSWQHGGCGPLEFPWNVWAGAPKIKGGQFERQWSRESWPKFYIHLSPDVYKILIFPRFRLREYIYIGYIPTPLTVNKMVCFYFYHPGGAPRFSWFSCVFLWWYFWCILMCSCVLFLVRFSRVFCRAFSGVFWWFCWWYFLCFSWCFFHCVLVLFSVLFFVLVPFLFYIRFPLVVVLFFAVLFFVVFGCFFRVFFRAFCGVFFCVFYRAFFRAFFRYFYRIFFRVVFFVPWVAPETNNHNILHFGPCFFRCFFWWSLLVKIGYTQYIYIFMYRIYILHG